VRPFRLLARERTHDADSASILYFHQVYAAATSGYRAVTANTPIFLLAADSIHVDARKHGNASVGAVSGYTALIRFTFPHSYRTVPPQQPAGGNVSTSFRCDSSAAPGIPGSATEQRRAGCVSE
jgi:hypothetical protein